MRQAIAAQGTNHLSTGDPAYLLRGIPVSVLPFSRTALVWAPQSVRVRPGEWSQLSMSWGASCDARAW